MNRNIFPGGTMVGKRILTLPQTIAAAIVLCATPLSAEDDLEASCGGECEMEGGMPSFLIETDPNNTHWSYTGISGGEAHGDENWGCYYPDYSMVRRAHVDPEPSGGLYQGHKMNSLVTQCEDHDDPIL